MKIANSKNALIFLGGSFDPIHLGHINTAVELQKKFPNAQIIFLPCGTPVLKNECHASKEHRLEMMKLALQDYPEFLIDTREFNKTTPSYTIETLKDIRQSIEKDISVSLVIGQDAFAHFMKWYNWENILNDCHIINHQRPAQDLTYSKELQDFIDKHKTHDAKQLILKPNGYIYQLHLGNYPYSSTAIRHTIQTHKTPHGLPTPLIDYINKHHLYS